MVLHIEHLTKVYHKGVRANDDVSLDVAAGEVVGLLGHNGAGKTTLLDQVIGLTRPTSGIITIGGTDVVAHPAHARQACSLQPPRHSQRAAGLAGSQEQSAGLAGGRGGGVPATPDPPACNVPRTG